MLSLQPAPDVAPILVLAIGNPSRGDDALGPQAATALQALSLPGVEVLTDFQLQVEHALDLLGRNEVVFVDAAASGPAPFAFAPVAAVAEASFSSHSLSPPAVLDAYRRLTGAEPPQARLLAIRGYAFELGAPLSAAAEGNLAAAIAMIAAELRKRVAASVPNI
jgi:hydrogenase maturation protease